MRRPAAERGAILREVRDLIATDSRRRRLNRRPEFVAIAEHRDAGETELDRPALVVWGTDDVYISWKQADRQRESFPSARIELLEGLGHWPFLEDPARVAEHVIPFLRQQVRATKPN